MVPTRMRISPHVRASMTDDGLVLLDIRGGWLLSSNAVGARIWRLLEEGQPRAEIIGRLVDEYGVAADTAERDLSAFISALASRGLLAEERSC